MSRNRSAVVKRFTKLAKDTLEGKRIKEVCYMSPEETRLNHYTVCFVLEDGTGIMVMADDEGTDAGALFVSPLDPKKPTFSITRI